MDRRFLRSKEFLVAAAIAGLVVAGGVVAVTSGVLPFGSPDDACTVEDPAGTSLEPEVADTGPTRSGDRVTRNVTYILDPASLDGGDLAACTEVGDVELAPSSDDRVRVELRLTNRGDGAEKAVGDDQPRVRFTRDAGELHVAVDHPDATHADAAWGRRTTTLDAAIRVPPDLSPAATMRADEGDVRVRDVTVSGLALESDEGDVEGSAVTVEGDVALAVDEGSVTMEVASLSSGSWGVDADEGDVDLEFPGGDRYGYDVAADSDLGDVSVDIGPTEEHSSSEDDGGESVTARSEGYSDKPVQVSVGASADEGDVGIAAR